MRPGLPLRKVAALAALRPLAGRPTAEGRLGPLPLAGRPTADALAGPLAGSLGCLFLDLGLGPGELASSGLPGSLGPRPRPRPSRLLSAPAILLAVVFHLS